MLKGIMVMVVSAVLCVGTPLLAIAQEDVQVDFESGSVVEFSTDSLTIETLSEPGKKVFVINDKTTLENMDAIDKLVAGDTVYIDFIEDGGQNIAMNIFKSSESSGEDTMVESDEGLYQDLGDEQKEKE